MEFLKDRRIVLAIGAGVALLLGILIAVTIMRASDGPTAPPPASTGGLVVETSKAEDDARLDASRPIRCFVAGQFVGEITLAECAQRNGVATGALDVGVDETGALAAADAAGTILAPLPPKPIAQQPSNPVVDDVQPTQASGQGQTCWRYAGGSSNGGWTQAGSMDLNGCVQTLFAGQCEKRGGATYGRWGEQTLRLVRGKVEISSDNRRFSTLVEQGANCSVPSVG